MKIIRSVAAVLIGLAIVSTSSSVRAVDFDDIQLWAGSGANQAALVINWTDGTTSQSLLWGYRWDGTATGEQMLHAVMAADSRLYAEVSGTTQYGTALFGIGYDLNNNGIFTTSPALSFDSQHFASGGYGDVDDSRIATDAGDLWQEGWYSAGYWSYWLSTESRLSLDFTDWDYSGVGMSGRELSNGDWDGWSFDYDFVWPAPTPAIPDAVQPVPEPSSFGLCLAGGSVLLFRRFVRRTNLPAKN